MMKEVITTMCVDAPLTQKGILVNSGPFDGLTSEQAKIAITDHLESLGKGRRIVQYRLRDWSVSRQRYWGSPIPVYYSSYMSTLSRPFVATGDGSPRADLKTITRESVGVIVRHRTKEQYLFIQRKNNPSMPTWFVHGGIEEGQTLEDAVRAEVREEA
jgi:valyl-tRNA synthetase